jgi:hypothetical protein
MNKPYFFSLSISAVLMLSLAVTMTMTVHTAQAQSSNSNSKACPPGFSLNRGVCQAEPELTCENYNIAPEWVAAGRLILDENGDCFVKEYTTAVCLNEDETQIIGFYFPNDVCLDTSTNQVIPNEEPACKSPTQPNHPINTATLVTVPNSRPSIQCEFLTELGPADPECNVGILNEESGMCEIKPGNRAGGKA